MGILERDFSLSASRVSTVIRRDRSRNDLYDPGCSVTLFFKTCSLKQAREAKGKSIKLPFSLHSPALFLLARINFPFPGKAPIPVSRRFISADEEGEGCRKSGGFSD